MDFKSAVAQLSIGQRAVNSKWFAVPPPVWNLRPEPGMEYLCQMVAERTGTDTFRVYHECVACRPAGTTDGAVRPLTGLRVELGSGTIV